MDTVLSRLLPLARSLCCSALLFSAACQTTGSSTRHVYRLRVDRGDTLASIARKYDTSADKIVKLNGLKPNEAPRVGSVLRVEPGPAGLLARDAVAAPGDEDEPDEDLAGRHTAQGGRGLLFGSSGGHEARLDWPLTGALSSPYGRRHGRFHHGIDIRAKTGSAVLSAAPGVVEFAGKQHGYGRVVIIRHKQIKTLYAHLARIEVGVGDKVARGSEVGVSGQSGNSTGPHLHFEIRNLKGDSVDPLTVIEKDRLLSSRF